MTCRLQCRWRSARAVLLLGSLFLGAAAHSQTSLSAGDVIARAVKRADSAASRPGGVDYEYRKHTVTEEMDREGRLKEHREKLYDVLVASGLSYLKLIQVNGRDLSPAALAKQAERDAADRAKLTDARPGAKGDDRENFLTADLVAKYQFTLAGQTAVRGRDTYVITFRPKNPNLPVRRLTDRFVNHIAGTVWIDAEDFEIARAEIHLQGEVELWGGIVGTLRRCDFTLTRMRLPDGNWFNSFSHGTFEGRKLMEPLVIRTMSESSDFHPVIRSRG